MFESLQTKGMFCSMYAGSGCAGIISEIPLGRQMNLRDMNFTGMAKSFMCTGGI
jgi:hypothetical protein